MTYDTPASQPSLESEENAANLASAPQTPEGTAYTSVPQPSAPPASSTQEFPSPGLTPVRRYGTAIMLFVLGLFVVGVVFYEGGSGIVSAIMGLLLIAGFIWYLRMIAPAPFTLKITPEALIREEAGQEPLMIPWGRFVRVKEEQFTNKKIISVTVYKKVGTRGVHRALVLYRDDLPRFDEFRKALKDATLPETPWHLETVHE